MKRLLSKKGRIITLIIIGIIVVISIVLSPLVKINYDMRQYLSEESYTKQGLDKLQEEFGESSMIQIMIENATLITGSLIADEINELESVKSVIWLGTVTDLSIPVENMDQVLIKEFYNDGTLLYTIEFNHDDYSLELGEAIDTIKEIAVKYESTISLRGPGVEITATRRFVDEQMILILAVAIPLAILILFLASTSWLEPVVILINLGVAIVINLGTNFLLPNVSYITMSIASILQLAMSLDYSLFIVHRYYEERDKGLEPIEAATTSVKDAFKTVTASALTTIFGFLALIIMRYRIGSDVGLSLVKAIFISYLTTIILLPILLILFDKPLIKLKHKMIMPRFKRIITCLHKGRYVIAVGFLLIGGLAFYLQGKTNYKYGDTPSEESTTETSVHQRQIKEKFGPFQPVLILYEHADQQNAILMSNKLGEIEEVRQIQSLLTSVDPNIPEEFIPPEALMQFKSNNYYRMIVYLDITQENERMYEVSNEIMAITTNSLSNQGYVIGVPVATTEIKNTVSADGILVQLVSVIAIALTIAIILKNPITPIILVSLIQVSIWINLSITVLSGALLAYLGFLVVSSLQLGATIDYAVLLSGRYQEFRKTLPKKEAMIEAGTRSTPAIITSAAVLSGAGFVVAIVSKLEVVREIGLLIGRGALLSGVLVIFILPALLLSLDSLINKTNIKIGFKKKPKTTNGGVNDEKDDE